MIRTVLRKELDIPVVEVEDDGVMLEGADILFTGNFYIFCKHPLFCCIFNIFLCNTCAFVLIKQVASYSLGSAISRMKPVRCSWLMHFLSFLVAQLRYSLKYCVN